MAKILVYPHSLHIGGSQLVAINLAWAVKERGHEVVVFGPPGALVEFADGRGLRVIEQARPNGRRPSLWGTRTLREVVRRERVDLVHGYGHSVCLEAYFGPHLLDGVPLVCSERGQVVPRPFPKHLPLIVAHGPLAEEAKSSGYRDVHLMRPLVDTEANRPDAVEGAEFRKQHGLDDGRATVVLVSRLARAVKLEGLQRAISAVGRLASSKVPVRLVVVGGGEAEEELGEAARRVNARVGWQAIVLTGPMLDPRPAYAAADVVLGMQGSILRGMAFEKPAIVVGERGFSEVVSDATVDRFLSQGFYGLGNGDFTRERLPEQIGSLLGDPVLRKRLGTFSREVVDRHVSLAAAADQLEAIYERTLSAQPARWDRLSKGVAFATLVAARRLGRVARRANARPEPA
ncbi:MAG TPA: glycosyltransferase [Actinomycetota bacterium]|nr:glycosyltransferase [Actinomycetota bacterium]